MPAVVIYTYDDGFKAGYEKLMERYPHIKFIFQIDFKEQTMENMGEYTMFQNDDDIMIDPFSEDCPEFLEFKRNPEILCLSLRMSFKYPRYRGAPLLKNQTWEWKGTRWGWGYPMAVTATIFRSSDLIPILVRNKTDMRTPSDLEVALMADIPNRPLMMCCERPKFINILANQVHKTYFYPTLDISLEDMEKRFLGGERLRWEPLKELSKVARSPFLKIPFEWEKDD
jgi:hypothetical protein